LEQRWIATQHERDIVVSHGEGQNLCTHALVKIVVFVYAPSLGKRTLGHGYKGRQHMMGARSQNLCHYLRESMNPANRTILLDVQPVFFLWQQDQRV
jgi:hypothetical protein